MTSPDRVRDYVSERLREVDASIKYVVGTVPILITVECRKRRPVQDVRWIEELAGKKANIRATKTIAVSATGFSAGAVAAAAAAGIELRNLTEVSAADIVSWLQPTTMIHRVQRSLITSANVFLKPPRVGAGGAPLTPEVRDQRVEQGLLARVIKHVPSGEHTSLMEIWLKAQAIGNFHAAVPEDGSRLSARVQLKIEPGLFTLETTAGPSALTEISLEVELWKEHVETPFYTAAFHHYASPDGSTVQHAEYHAQFGNLNIGLGLQGVSDSNVVGFDLRIAPE